MKTAVIWNRQVEWMQKSYQVIVPDLPGTGASALTEDVSMESMANQLKTLLDKEGIQQCTLLGHSMGAYISLAFAERFPGSGARPLAFLHSNRILPTMQLKKEAKA
ncbi:MAG: hypothetical protein BEV12_24165 [Microcystis aeruginosa CACIAM 03]|nr:MAG: hypothetical protein BEV12_24165 [Microcystis aeruginosa CACIAM 03]